jgi:hypothetical protein
VRASALAGLCGVGCGLDRDEGGCAVAKDDEFIHDAPVLGAVAKERALRDEVRKRGDRFGVAGVYRFVLHDLEGERSGLRLADLIFVEEGLNHVPQCGQHLGDSSLCGGAFRPKQAWS